MIVVRTSPDLLIEDGYKRITVERDGAAWIHVNYEVVALRVDDLDLPHQEVVHSGGYHPAFDRESARTRINREYGLSPEDMEEDKAHERTKKE